jgi:TonB family protein
MTRHEMQSVVPIKPDNYETVVLDFLDREMAVVQPNTKTAEHSDDTDVLLSDLLKQVLQESDQPKSSPLTILDDREAMLAEFPPTEVTAAPAGNKTIKSDNIHWPIIETSPEIVEVPSVFADQLLKLTREITESDNPLLESADAAVDCESNALELSAEPQADAADEQLEGYREPATEVSESQPTPIIAESLFATPANAKSKTPMIAAAACLFATIGFSAYHFLNSSKTESNITESRIALQDSIALASQPQASPNIARPVPATLKKKASSPAKIIEQAPAVTIKTEPVTPIADQALLVPEPPRNERPGLIQRTLQIATNTSDAIIDKLVPSTVPEKSSPVAPRPASPAATPSSSPTVSGVLIPAIPISQVSPQYPKLAVKTRASATVVLDLVINEKGKVIDATPVSGPTIFHREAMDAALQWKYQPASLGGVHVRSQSRIIMNFKLK